MKRLIPTDFMRLKKLSKIFIPLIFFCILCGLVYLNKDKLFSRFENFCLDYLRNKYHLEISFEKEEIDLWNSTFRFKKVNIVRYPDLDISIDEISMRVAPLRIFTRKVSLESLEINNGTLKLRATERTNSDFSFEDIYSLPLAIRKGSIRNSNAYVDFKTGKLHAHIPEISIKEDDRFVKQYLHDVRVRDAKVFYVKNNKENSIAHVNLEGHHREASVEITLLSIKDRGNDIVAWGTFQNQKNFVINSTSTLNAADFFSILEIPCTQGTLKESTVFVANRGVYSLESNVSAAKLSLDDFVVNEFRVEVRTNFKELRIQGEYISASEGKISFNPVIDLTSSDYKFKGNVKFTNFTLTDILDIFNQDTDVIGLTISKGRVETMGTIKPFHLTGRALLHTKEFSVHVEGRHIVSLENIPIDAHIDVDDKRFEITKALVGKSDNAINVHGYFSFKDTLALYFDSKKYADKTLKLFKRGGAVEARGQGSITGDYDDIDFTIEFFLYSLRMEYARLADIEGVIENRANMLEIRNVRSKTQSLVASADCRIGLGSSDTFFLKANVEFAKLFDILTLPKKMTPSIMEARLQGDITLEKKNTHEGSFHIEKIGALTLGDEHFNTLRLDGTIINDLMNVAFRMVKDDGEINLEGTIDHFNELNLNLISKNLTTESFSLFKKTPLPFSSQILIKGLFSGTLDHPLFNGSAAFIDTKFSGIPYVNSIINLDYREGVYSSKGNLFNDVFVFDGTYTKAFDTFNFTTDFSHIKIHELLAPFFTENLEHLEISVSGQGKLEGTFADGPLIGTITFSELTLIEEKYKIKNTEKIKVTIDSGKFFIPLVHFNGPEARFSLEGSISNEGDLALVTEGYTDLLFIGGLTALSQTSGTSNFKLNLTGKVEDVRLNGEGTIKDLRFRIPDLTGEFYNGDAFFTISQNRLKISKASLDFGNGKIKGEGEIIFENLRPKIIDIDFSLANIAIAGIKDFSCEISSNLTLNGPPEKLFLKGDAVIKNLQFKRRLDYRSKVLSILDIFKHSKKLTIKEEEKEFLFFDIRLEAQENIVIENELLHAKLLANLNVTGSNRSLGLLGTIKVKEGSALSFRGKEFTITSGNVEFIDPRSIAFLYAVFAEADIADYHIVLNASGDADTVNVVLSSEPELSREDVISVLEVGVTLAEREDLSLGKWEAAAAVSGKAQDFLEKELLKKLKIIKSIQIVPTFSENSKEVQPLLIVFSESIKGVNLNYKSTLTNVAEQELEAEYRVTRKFSVLANWKDEGVNNETEVGMDFRFKFEFK